MLVVLKLNLTISIKNKLVSLFKVVTWFAEEKNASFVSILSWPAQRDHFPVILLFVCLPVHHTV